MCVAHVGIIVMSNLEYCKSKKKPPGPSAINLYRQLPIATDVNGEMLFFILFKWKIAPPGTLLREGAMKKDWRSLHENTKKKVFNGMKKKI